MSWDPENPSQKRSSTTFCRVSNEFFLQASRTLWIQLKKAINEKGAYVCDRTLSWSHLSGMTPETSYTSFFLIETSFDIPNLRDEQDWSDVIALRKSPQDVSIRASSASFSIVKDSFSAIIWSLKIKIQIYFSNPEVKSIHENFKKFKKRPLFMLCEIFFISKPKTIVKLKVQAGFNHQFINLTNTQKEKIGAIPLNKNFSWKRFEPEFGTPTKK